MEPSCAWLRSEPNRVGGNIVLSQNVWPGTLFYCILQFSCPDWSMRASLRGSDLSSPFSKTVILHLDMLLKSFNCHCVASSSWSRSDPLFRIRRHSVFSLIGGADVEICSMMWVLRMIPACYEKPVGVSLMVWRKAWSLSIWWYSAGAYLHPGLPCLSEALGLSLPWDRRHFSSSGSFSRTFPGWVFQMIPHLVLISKFEIKFLQPLAPILSHRFALLFGFLILNVTDLPLDTHEPSLL